ncbi:fibropellin-1 isoform X10 [Hydra vulgaris]|uniref:Fibropellin-1 isoform X10 n=1 Tax=Hydra vulgaris TaxID=6087 RepID=A0ABM4BRD7_HYDVU
MRIFPHMICLLFFILVEIVFANKRHKHHHLKNDFEGIKRNKYPLHEKYKHPLSLYTNRFDRFHFFNQKYNQPGIKRVKLFDKYFGDNDHIKKYNHLRLGISKDTVIKPNRHLKIEIGNYSNNEKTKENSDIKNLTLYPKVNLLNISATSNTTNATYPVERLSNFKFLNKTNLSQQFKNEANSKIKEISYLTIKALPKKLIAINNTEPAVLNNTEKSSLTECSSKECALGSDSQSKDYHKKINTSSINHHTNHEGHVVEQNNKNLGRVHHKTSSVEPALNIANETEGNIDDTGYHQSHPDLLSDKTQYANYLHVHDELQQNASGKSSIANASDGIEEESNFQSSPDIMQSESTKHINYLPIHVESHSYLAPVHTHVNHDHENAHHMISPNYEEPDLPIQAFEHHHADFGSIYSNSNVDSSLPIIHHHHFNEPEQIEHSEFHEYPCLNGGVYYNTGEKGYQCTCIEGFTGAHCQEVNHCHPQPCLNNGVCHPVDYNPFFICQCKVGFIGIKCNETNPCYPNPCKNNGVCSHNGTDVTCVCSPKFTGAFCEKSKSCLVNPCQNGGVCIELEGDGKFQCHCQQNWKGPLCADFDHCYKNPCENGGICLEGFNNFSCKCLNGFSGVTCQDHVCSPNPCLNGGTCLENGDKFKCICPKWASGELCEENKPCLINPCLNDGKCIDGSSGFQWSFAPLQYYCLCKPPYKGIHCEQKENMCHPNPCFNNGHCMESPANCQGDNCGFTCVCLPPYLPPLCKEANPCVPNPCENGECQSIGNGDVMCKCNEGFKGKLCGEIDACFPNPCQHNGKCHSVKGIASCSCAGMWKTPFCKECGCPTPHIPGIPDMSCSLNGACSCPNQWIPDMSKGLCTKSALSCNSRCCSLPCDNGGTCVDLPNGQFKCYCKTGTTGEVCQFKTAPFFSQPVSDGVIKPNGFCNPNPCLQKGVCIVNRGGYDCVCLQRYTGPHCEVDRCANCHKHARCANGLCKCKKGWIGNGLNCIREMCEETCIEWSTCINGNCVCDVDAPQITHKCIPALDDDGDDDDSSDRIDKTVHPTPTFVSPLLITRQTVPMQTRKKQETTKVKTLTSTSNTVTDGYGPPGGPVASQSSDTSS